MRSASIVLLLLILPILAFAQPPDSLWSQTYGGVDRDGGNCVQQTLDGGFIIAGYTESFGGGGYDVYLIKTDANGDTIWTRTIGGSTTEQAEYIQQTADGGYIIVGSFWSWEIQYSDVYLIKTDDEGNVEWSETYGGADHDGGYCVQQTTDGGYIIVGTLAFDDVYLIKTDNLGNELWSQTFGGVDEDIGYSVRQTAEGGYIITGETESYGAGGEDLYLIKTDDLGNELWSQVYGDVWYDAGYEVQQTYDGGYIISGYYNGGALWVIKTNKVGSIRWSITLGDIYPERGYSVQQTAEGGYIVAGYTESYSAGGSDVWLMRIEGELTITLTPVSPPIVVPEAGGSFDFIIELRNGTSSTQTFDLWCNVEVPIGSQFTVLGPINLTFPSGVSVTRLRSQAVPLEAPGGQYTYWGFLGSYPWHGVAVDKFNFQKAGADGDWSGSDGWDCTGDLFPEEGAQVSGIVPDGYMLYNAHPNPFNPTTTLSFALPEAAKVNIAVYDISGRQVAELVNGWRDAGLHEVTFDGSGLASGMYLYRLSAGEFTANGKMVLLK